MKIRFIKIIVYLILLTKYKSSKVIMMDRINKADDNAEILYSEFNYKKKYFVISKNSKDYLRLKNKNYNVISYGTLKYYIYLYTSKMLISSHADYSIVNPLGNGIFNIARNYKFIFLQHGIINSDLSSWLNPKNIDLIITSTEKEYDLISNTINVNKVCLTGMPRFDVIYNKIEKYNVIFPTWRSSIMNEEQLTKSIFFNKWVEFANNIDEDTIFILHNKMEQYFDLYCEKINNPNITIVKDSDARYREICMEGKKFITDFSSFFNDFIFLDKPVFFYSFDDKLEHLSSISRDMELYNDVGIIFKDYSEYSKISCTKKVKDGYFMYKDTNNCNRILEEINKLL